MSNVISRTSGNIELTCDERCRHSCPVAPVTLVLERVPATSLNLESIGSTSKHIRFLRAFAVADVPFLTFGEADLRLVVVEGVELLRESILMSISTHILNANEGHSTFKEATSPLG
jgi:hypothetical protein